MDILSRMADCTDVLVLKECSLFESIKGHMLVD